jgi:hypothetical protein
MANPVSIPTVSNKKKKGSFRSTALPWIIIPIGALLMMALTWLLYGLIFNLLEALFFPDNSLAFPAGLVRRTYAVVLVLLYLILLRTRLADLVKAILITGPLSTVIITVGLAFYEKPVISIIVMVASAATCGIFLYLSKKSWLYYYAGIIASLAGLAYAWPAA